MVPFRPWYKPHINVFAVKTWSFIAKTCTGLGGSKIVFQTATNISYGFVHVCMRKTAVVAACSRNLPKKKTFMAPSKLLK